jgi:hypothetical protein
MFTYPRAVPKIESPSTSDTPRQTYATQPLSQFGRLPRIPCFLVRYVDLGVHSFGTTFFGSETEIFPRDNRHASFTNAVVYAYRIRQGSGHFRVVDELARIRDNARSNTRMMSHLE